MNASNRLNEIRISHARWAGGLGVGTVFVPLADMVVMGTIWTSLLIQIADEAGHTLDENYAKKFAASVVKGTLFYMAGSRLATWVVSLTGIGAPGAMAVNAALNYGYTWLMGGFLIEQFSKPDVDLSGLAKAATVYLLSFGIGTVTHFYDVATAGTDVHDAIATATDVHHATTLADTGHVAAHAGAIRFGAQDAYAAVHAAVSAQSENYQDGVQALIDASHKFPDLKHNLIQMQNGHQDLITPTLAQAQEKLPSQVMNSFFQRFKGYS